MNTQVYTTKIIIVGAGIVGLSLALGLVQQNIDVVVIDRQVPPTGLSDEPSLRVSAINPMSQILLQQLEVWDQLIAARVQPYQGMEIWEKDSFGRLCFDHTDLDQCHELGWIIENNHLQQTLIQQLQNYTQATLLFSEQPEQLQTQTREAVLQLHSGKVIIGELVVAADGVNSWVRQQQQTPMTYWDYNQHAIIATVRTALPHQGIARQCFSPTGPIALLPLWDNQLSSLVWSADTHLANELIHYSDQEFAQRLTVAVDACLGLCELTSQRQTFPLMMRYAKRWLSTRTVLVGDAAHSIHPLAGLGLNLGLADVTQLLMTLTTLPQQQPHDFGATNLLRRYERCRKAEAQDHIVLMEALKQLFGQKQEIVKLIRSVGLSLVNQMSPIKQQLIQLAMGRREIISD